MAAFAQKYCWSSRDELPDEQPIEIAAFREKKEGGQESRRRDREACERALG